MAATPAAPARSSQTRTPRGARAGRRAARRRAGRAAAQRSDGRPAPEARAFQRAASSERRRAEATTTAAARGRWRARARARPAREGAAARVHHRRLRERAQRLVRRLHRHVRAARERRRGGGRRRGRRAEEAEVRAVRLVDDERHAARLALRRCARHVGEHAVVRRRHEEDGGDRPRRGAAERGAHLGGGHADAQPARRIVRRRQPDGRRPTRSAPPPPTGARCGSSTAGVAAPRCRASCTHASTAAITPSEPLTRYHVRAAPTPPPPAPAHTQSARRPSNSPSISGSRAGRTAAAVCRGVSGFAGRAACRHPSCGRKEEVARTSWRPRRGHQ